jgi:hypothetical protein
MMTVTDIDLERHRVRCGTQWRSLSPQVWRSFETLHRHRGHVVRSTTLIGFNGGESWRREPIRLLRPAIIFCSPEEMPAGKTISFGCSCASTLPGLIDGTAQPPCADGTMPPLAKPNKLPMPPNELLKIEPMPKLVAPPRRRRRRR